MMRIEVEADEKTPAFDDEFGRINVFLGTNGTGKSKLLAALARGADAIEGYKVVRAIGARAAEIQTSVSAQTTFNDSKEFENFDDELIQDFSVAHAQPDPEFDSAQWRFSSALNTFARNLAKERMAHTKKRLAWLANPSESPPVLNERDPNDHICKLLDLFTEIFPDIHIGVSGISYTDQIPASKSTALLDFNGLSNRIQGRYTFSLNCEKNGNSYSPSELSDGEKQIFSLLADRYFLNDGKCLFITDEPELNLDPVLAAKYWTLMERENPHSIFVYATHSLDFALRKDVDRVWVIGKGRASLLDGNALQQLTRDDRRTFLSGIRGILNADRGLIVEGDEDSFDSLFYRWVLQDNAIQIRGYGGCEDVTAATKKLDMWQEIAPGARIIGIIDADYRSDSELAKLDNTNCLALTYHDAESYLCHPDLLIALAENRKWDVPSQEEVRATIIGFVKETEVDICHDRMARQTKSVNHVALTNSRLQHIADVAELKETVVAMANKTNSGVSADRVAEIINEEQRKCAKAKSDIELALRLGKGKDLLGKFAVQFSLAKGEEGRIKVMKEVKNNLCPNDFPHIVVLANAIRSKLATTSLAIP